jgi:hypothetical protein
VLTEDVVRKGIDRLIIDAGTTFEKEEIRPKIELIHEKIRYWTIQDFNTVIEYIIEKDVIRDRRDYKVATFKKIYKELNLGKKKNLGDPIYSCEICKGEGAIVYYISGKLKIAYCSCKTGRAIKRTNPDLLPWEDLEGEVGIKRVEKGSMTAITQLKVSLQLWPEEHPMREIIQRIIDSKISRKEFAGEVKKEMRKGMGTS